MQWLYPAGAWGLISLLLITALYLLRRKSESVRVPSLLLWRRAMDEQSVTRPFQKLRKNALLFLQLLLALLLVVSLMRPVRAGGMRGETVMIFDLSASMQTETAEGTRLDTARRRALSLLDGMREGDRVTILTAGAAVEAHLTRSGDLTRARETVQALSCENGAADMAGAVSLAQAMARDIEGLSIVAFSDTFEAPDPVQIVRVGQAAENRALLSLTASDGQAFVRVANYGGDAQVTLECYADGALCDVTTLTLPEGETAAALLRVPAEFEEVRAVIAERDALPLDNERWCVRQGESGYRVSLSGENVFLEKAFALREDVTLVRATAQEALESGDMDLYVFDGEMPSALPEGALLLVNPAGDIAGFSVGEAKTAASGALRAAFGERAQALTENLLLEDIALRAYRPLAGGEAVLQWNGDTLLSVLETPERRAAALGFDLHDSNLPLKGDFPVLVQNLLAFLLPETRQALKEATCREAFTLPYDARAESVRVALPSGRTAEGSAGEAWTDTGEQGVYTLTYAYRDRASRTLRLPVHMENAESDTRAVGGAGGAAVTARLQSDAGREATVWTLLLFLALLLVEWGVSRRVA